MTTPPSGALVLSLARVLKSLLRPALLAVSWHIIFSFLRCQDSNRPLHAEDAPAWVGLLGWQGGGPAVSPSDCSSMIGNWPRNASDGHGISNRKRNRLQFSNTFCNLHASGPSGVAITYRKLSPVEAVRPEGSLAPAIASIFSRTTCHPGSLEQQKYANHPNGRTTTERRARGRREDMHASPHRRQIGCHCQPGSFTWPSSETFVTFRASRGCLRVWRFQLDKVRSRHRLANA